MSRNRHKPAVRPTPAPPRAGGPPPIPLVKRRWLLALAVTLEALWLAALVLLSLR